MHDDEAYNTVRGIANVRAEVQALAQRWIQIEHEMAERYRKLEELGIATDADTEEIGQKMGEVRRLISEKIEELTQHHWLR